jgi:hypothetical protein
MEQKSKNHNVLYALVVGFFVLVVVYFTFFAGSKDDIKKDDTKKDENTKPDDKKDIAAGKPLQNPPPRTTNPNEQPTQPAPIKEPMPVIELNPKTLQKEVVTKSV